ncbi:MAG TPA: lipopolysaccharide biosynthesis protein [bacterium]|nr:lipopolysaccharide biosynthesis protein [bacterium]
MLQKKEQQLKDDSLLVNENKSQDKPLSLKKNFSWAFIGNIINVICLWGVVTAVVKLGSVEMVGQLELARTIAMPVIMIVMFQLSAIQVTDAQNKYSFSEYLGTRLSMTLIGIILFAMISFVYYDGNVSWIIMLWGLAKCIDSISDIIKGLFQKHERMNLCAISFMVRSPAVFLSLALTLWLTNNLFKSLVAVVFAWSFSLIVYDIPNAKHLLNVVSARNHCVGKLFPEFNFGRIKSLLWLSFPLGIVMFLGAIQNSISRLVLEHYHGAESLGYFGPLVYPMSIGTMAIAAMGQSASPRLAHYFVHNLPAYIKLMKKLLLLALIGGIIFVISVVVFGKIALRLIYTADYAQYNVDFVILSIGGAISFLSYFCGYGLTAARIFKMQLILAIVACSVSAIASFLLIPHYGIRGASITYSIVMLALFICSIATLIYSIEKRRKQLIKQVGVL